MCQLISIEQKKHIFISLRLSGGLRSDLRACMHVSTSANQSETGV
jgi:hypothetical protein